ncbi:hypothetical protein AB1Y20_022087 [Prymnesium parvum]|uniref:Lipoyl-binding domain-containing protein n=1 Tax=Prymnesium parvum TaxID=97485 RepID=A0AB34JHS5_PRYPA
MMASARTGLALASHAALAAHAASSAPASRGAAHAAAPLRRTLFSACRAAAPSPLARRLSPPPLASPPFPTRALAIQRFPVPNMGDSISEGTLLAVSKAVGDHVALEEVIAQIETDKVTVDVRSPAEGTVTALFAKPEETVLVGSDLIEIDVGAGAAAPAASPPDAAAPPPAAPPPREASPSTAADAARRVHPSGRPSLMGFPPRGKAAAARPPSPPVESPDAKAPAGKPEAQPKMPKIGSVPLAGVPARFRRKPMSKEEMEAVDSGGATYIS